MSDEILLRAPDPASFFPMPNGRSYSADEQRNLYTILNGQRSYAVMPEDLDHLLSHGCVQVDALAPEPAQTSEVVTGWETPVPAEVDPLPDPAPSEPDAGPETIEPQA